MHVIIEIILFVLLIFLGIISLQVKNLLISVAVLTAFSFATALLYVIMGALDVGFTETVVGAGITGVLFVALIYKTTRRSLD
jgi:multicomponent Na+:H+ antiporter subunit B